MKKYLNPEMIIELIESNDILTLSDQLGNNISVLDFGEDFT